MANLTKADLGKRGNDEVILKKFFHMDNHMNIFAVKRKMGSPKEGQFIPTVMVFVVDGEETDAFPLAIIFTNSWIIYTHLLTTSSIDPSSISHSSST